MENLVSRKGFELDLVLELPNDPKPLLILFLHLGMNLNTHEQLGIIRYDPIHIQSTIQVLA